MIKSFRKELEDLMNDYLNNNNYYKKLKIEDNERIKLELIYEIEIIFENLYNLKEEDYDLLKESIELILLNYKKKNIIYNEKEIEKLKLKILELQKLKQPEQRSEEWYKYRNNRLTASDLGTAMNKNPYSTRNKLIVKKCGYEEKFIISDAIKHGVKYEDVAIYFYEKLNDVKIDEYGCIPHPEHEFFGASPDGICSYESTNKNYIGRMLEIKCPKSRKLKGIIPEYYELQIQGQLEVCDLEYCDYLECKILEYNDLSDFLDDSFGSNLMKTKKNLMKGIVIEFFNLDKTENVYEYIYEFETESELTEKLENCIFKKYNNMEYITTTYWRIEEYDLILVKRDKNRFDNILFKEIDKFWKDVLYYRKNGYEKLFKKKDPIKYKPKEFNFLPDSDTES